MEISSTNSSSLTEKSSLRKASGPCAGPTRKRAYRSYSASDRAEFFLALERLGTIPLAARELGFNLSTCRAWAGLSGRKSGQKYTQAEKDKFFVLLDRVGSVSLAAQALGINVQTCFHWAYKAGAVTRKPGKTPVIKQSATQVHKDEFFAVLTRVGSVSVAARELGLERSRCVSWARHAGIKSIQPGVRKRAEFLRLREAGVGRKEAAAAAGASRKSGYLWDNERVQAGDRAVGPDALDLAYKQEMTTTFAESSAPDTAPATPAVPAPSAGPEAVEAPEPAAVALEALERSISARYLSLPDRVQIADLLARNDSMRAIAQALGRSPSSIKPVNQCVNSTIFPAQKHLSSL